MKTTRRKHGHRARPVMNVTPLVDVVLVLLIIFMIVIPAMNDALQIELPGITNVDDARDNSADPFLLSLTRDGELYLDESEVQREGLDDVLRSATEREPNRRLVLQGDGRVRYVEVRELYALAQEIGFPGVSLRVNQRDEEEQ